MSALKLNRTTSLVAICSAALLVILAIQLNWIMQTARYKEEYFAERGNIVLARTTESITNDSALSRRLGTGMTPRDSVKIDSLIHHYMSYYNFHVPYSFTLGSSHFSGFSFTDPAPGGCFVKSLDDLNSKNAWVLQLHFPERDDAVRAEMGIPFFASVLITILVLALFGKTVSSLLAQKKIAEHQVDFLNSMTHEFKTPLTSISLATKMILKDATQQQQEEIRDNCGIILKENERLRLQVEQVLGASIHEKDQFPLQKTEVDIHQLISNSVELLGMQIASRQVNLKIGLEAQRTVVMGDKTHLTNALRNLLDNAIKYAGTAPALCVETHNTANKVVIVIEDNGPGIPAEYHKKVFEKFFRIPGTPDAGGFGLGLHYVKRVIDLHEGTIALKSGQGTTFTITLPHE